MHHHTACICIRLNGPSALCLYTTGLYLIKSFVKGAIDWSSDTLFIFNLWCFKQLQKMFPIDIYLSCNGCVCKKNHPDTMVKAEENIIIHIPNLVMTALVHCLCLAMGAFAKISTRAVSSQQIDSFPNPRLVLTILCTRCMCKNIPNSDQRKREKIAI